MLIHIMTARHDLLPSKMHSSPTSNNDYCSTIQCSYFLCNLDLCPKYKTEQFTSINPETKRQPCSLPAPHSLFSSSSPFASHVCSLTCTVAYLLPYGSQYLLLYLPRNCFQRLRSTCHSTDLHVPQLSLL